MFEKLEIEVSQPQDTFLAILVQFANVMLKIVQQIYRHQCAPSVLWTSVTAVGKDMTTLHSKVQANFGIELDAPRHSDARGMRPTVLITCPYHFLQGPFFFNG